MNWSNITVEQYQELYRLSLSQEIEEMDRITKSIAILNKLTEKQVDELPMADFGALARKCSFLFHESIPGKPEKTIKANGKMYAMQYDPKKLKHRQYVEVLHFGQKPIENMHMIMASLVMPLKWGFIRRDNRAEHHDKVAEDMLHARLIDIYHSCVFFCKLYTNSIEVIRAFLVKEMMTTGMTTNQAQEAITLSVQNMVGFSQLKKSQNMKQ